MTSGGKKPGMAFWIVGTIAVAIGTSALWTWGPHDGEICFWGMVLPWSVTARFQGKWAGARLGAVAQHAIGWFAAFVSAGAVILILDFIERPEAIFRDYRDGLGASAWIFAIFAALIAETCTSMIELCRQCTQTAKNPP